MVGLREIPRTAAFTWSPGASSPVIATGTKAGAVDEGFSNDTQLELWDLELGGHSAGRDLEPIAGIDTDSRFNDIAWTKESDSKSRGIIAGALENGSLDLWDADKLLAKDKSAFLSRTQKHSGSIKALQFNTFRSSLLATVGAKGELFIYDLSNVGNPFRMGNAVARADDFECLDWNKKSAHIMVTGSSGGTMTVWDIKNKRESLTLNNMGRKPVSAVAWDPNKATRLITATPADTDPVVLVWDLRNANAPERVLKGHDGGVLSVSWCQQDPDLLLSCGKDNRNICWNPQTAEAYGEFPVVTNWTFQTRWCPSNPNFMATASFDGKISVNSIQSTRSDADGSAGTQLQNVDDDDFFNRAQTQPQGTSFTLSKAPKWLQRPCGANFGYGGKVVSFRAVASDNAKRSSVRISTFAVDDTVSDTTGSFETALRESDLEGICDKRISEAINEADKEDWRVIKTLTSDNTRKQLIDHLGFSTKDDESADGVPALGTNGEAAKGDADKLTDETQGNKSNRLSSFFENSADGDNFLSELAAAKGAKTNNPFSLYPGVESESDRRITRSLLLGEFEKALDVCLQEDRMSDAFMIAICGGQKCIDKAQKTYFNREKNGPNFLRLLASVVGKNLWDLVHNADLSSWKDVMASLCTYADTKEFPDLCEALGDRIEEKVQQGELQNKSRRDATFCYLAGSRLEKVVAIWIAEMKENESSGMSDPTQGSSFSVHARALQGFIEKVTVFREVTSYRDEEQETTGDWKLAALYDKYIEYADITSTHGQLEIAERYLNLLPDRYGAAEVAKNRVQQATRKIVPQAATKQQTQPNTQRANKSMPPVPDFQQRRSPVGRDNPYAPSASPNPYAPAGVPQNTASGYPQQPQQYPQSRAQLGGYPSQQYGMPNPPQFGAPPRNLNASPSVPPPSKATNMTNWNDTPEDFFKGPNSRRGTPAAVGPPTSTYQPLHTPIVNSFTPAPKSTPPLGPPPKGSVGPPPRMTSPPSHAPPPQIQQNVPPSNPSPYAPPQSTLPVQQQPATIPRGPSPYNAPPTQAPPSNRYAPAQPPPSTQATQQQNGPSINTRPPPPANPYAPQSNFSASSPQSAMPPGPPPSSGPPPSGPPPQAQQTQRNPAPPVQPKHPPGDRSHIPKNAQPIYQILSEDMQRVKARAPASFKAHVVDTEKRLNFLFDHLNNEDLLKPDTVASMADLAQAIRAKDYEQAQAIHVDIMTNKTDQCGNWMVGVKRLIAMSRTTQ